MGETKVEKQNPISIYLVDQIGFWFCYSRFVFDYLGNFIYVFMGDRQVQRTLKIEKKKVKKYFTLPEVELDARY